MVTVDITTLILDFVGEIAWPVVVIVVVALFRTQIREALGILSQFNKASKLSLKIAGQEMSLEREIKQQILKEEVAREAGQLLDTQQAEQVAKRVANAISPLIGSYLGEDALVILHVLLDAGGKLSREELKQKCAQAGVRAGVPGMVTRLHFDGFVSRSETDVTLTAMGERVAGMLKEVGKV
jgi:hypothetical protein